MQMRVSAGFLQHICGMEGMRTNVYQDSGGVPTIGCGHTGSGVRERSISKDRAYDLLRKDVERFENCVNSAIQVPMTQGMFDALVSLSYNMGCTGAISNTGIKDMMNAKQYEAVAAKIRVVGLRDRRGNYLRGLENRRKIESNMFMQDGLPGGTGNLTRKPVGTGAFSTPIPAWSWWVVGGLAVSATTLYTVRKLRPRRTR